MKTKKIVLTPSIYLWIFERLYVWFVNQIRFIIVFSKFTNTPKAYPLTILDIGCGDGFFLSDIPNSLFIKTGVDVVFPKKLPGITYFKGEFEKIKFDSKFDVAVANHVIEHIEDPKEFVKKMYLVTKPDAVVMLSTPNKDSLGYRWFKKNWYHFNVPYHRHLFTKNDLKSLLESAGFKKVEIRGEFPGFPMDIVRTLKKTGSIYLILLPVLMVGKLIFPETIVVTGRK